MYMYVYMYIPRTELWILCVVAPLIHINKKGSWTIYIYKIYLYIRSIIRLFILQYILYLFSIVPSSLSYHIFSLLALAVNANSYFPSRSSFWPFTSCQHFIYCFFNLLSIICSRTLPALSHFLSSSIIVSSYESGIHSPCKCHGQSWRVEPIAAVWGGEVVYTWTGHQFILGN